MREELSSNAMSNAAAGRPFASATREPAPSASVIATVSKRRRYCGEGRDFTRSSPLRYSFAENAVSVLRVAESRIALEKFDVPNLLLVRAMVAKHVQAISNVDDVDEPVLDDWVRPEDHLVRPGT